MLARKYKLDAKTFKSISNKTSRNLRFKDFNLKGGKLIGGPKFAVVISSKQLKKATDRNRIKRKYYSLIEKKLTALKFENFYLIIYPNKESLYKKSSLIDIDLEKAFLEFGFYG